VRELAKSALKVFEKAGVDFGDIRTEERKSTTIRIANEQLQALSSVVRKGFSVRAFRRGAWGYSSGTSFTLDSVKHAAEAAARIARANSTKGLPRSSLKNIKPMKKNLKPAVKIDPANIGLDEKTELAMTVSRAQRTDPKVASTFAIYGEWDYAFEVANTVGTDVSWREMRTRIGGQAVAAEGEKRDFAYDFTDGTGGYEIVKAVDPNEMGKTIASEAIELLTAKKPPSGMMTVITDPDISGLLAHEVMGHASEGDEITKRRSFLTDIVGKKVGSPLVTMYDDGTYPAAHGTIPFDCEGTPGHKTKIIDRGVYAGYMHSLETSGTLKMPLTGNGRAENYSRRVWVRMTNTYFAPGDDKFDEIVEETKDGLLTHKSISGMEDPVGGGFQAVALMGHLVKNGEIGPAVRGMTLTGKALEILKSVDMASREFKLSGGFCGKGEEDYVPVSSGGPYMRSKIIVGGG
jgi:TldD protein